MKYVIAGKSGSILIDDKNIVDVAFYPEIEPEPELADLNDHLGASLIIVMNNGGRWKVRGKGAEECWEAMGRDACWIKGKMSQVAQDE